MTEKEKEARISDLLSVAAMIASYRAHTITEDWLERSKQLLATFEIIDRLTEGEKPYSEEVSAWLRSLREVIEEGGDAQEQGTSECAWRISREITWPEGDARPCCVKCWWAKKSPLCVECGAPFEERDINFLAALSGIPSVDDILNAEEMHRQEIEAQSKETP